MSKKTNDIADMMLCRVISDPAELDGVAPFGDENYWSLFTARLVESHHTGGYKDSKTGKTHIPAIPTPQVLMRLAADYFNSVDQNPIITYGYHKGVEHEMRKPRPYTWAGFDEFLMACGIALRTYKVRQFPIVKLKTGEVLDYTQALADIDRVMWRQKFDGAATGLFNAVIISRELRLAEVVDANIVTEVEQNVNINWAEMSDAAIMEVLAKMKAAKIDSQNNADDQTA